MNKNILDAPIIDTFNPPTLKTRLNTLVLDIISIYILALFPVVILSVIIKQFQFGSTTFTDVLSSTMVALVLLNKDFLNGQSILRRYWGTQVVDCKTGKPASPIQCFIRNLTLLLWLVESLFLLVNRKRRLGDYIAGTQVILTASLRTKNQPILHSIRIDWQESNARILQTLLLISFITLFGVFGIYYFLAT